MYRDYGGTGDSSSLNDRLSRLQRLRETSSSGTTHTEYAYNGTNRLVKSDYTVPDVRREMYGSTAGDYDAWDRFGRTKRQQWEDYTGTPTTRDQFDYTYDYAGNRLTRTNTLHASLNQTYTYDGLHRLRSNNESGSTNDRYWKLDQLGNWESLYHNTSGTGTAAETRAHNAANELTGFTTPTSTVDPSYDAAGNMTTMPEPGDLISPLSLKYDAWNRLVEIDSYSGNADMTAEYDGLNRRIVRISGGETRHFYYNQQWQVLEERVGTSTTANKQFVYHPHYVDAIAVRRDASGNDHYFLQDANFNVTAVVDNTGTVIERYAYTPYGEVSVLDADFSADADGKSDISNEHLYTGRRRDPETGLQLNRNRFYAAGLGRWVNRDPIGYWGNSPNLYEYVLGAPLMLVDPWGLEAEKCDDCNKKRKDCLDAADDRYDDCMYTGTIFCVGVCRLRCGSSSWFNPCFKKCHSLCLDANKFGCLADLGLGRRCCNSKYKKCKDTGEWDEDWWDWFLSCP